MSKRKSPVRMIVGIGALAVAGGVVFMMMPRRPAQAPADPQLTAPGLGQIPVLGGIVERIQDVVSPTPVTQPRPTPPVRPTPAPTPSPIVMPRIDPRLTVRPAPAPVTRPGVRLRTDPRLTVRPAPAPITRPPVTRPVQPPTRFGMRSPGLGGDWFDAEPTDVYGSEGGVLQ